MWTCSLPVKIITLFTARPFQWAVFPRITAAQLVSPCARPALPRSSPFNHRIFCVENEVSPVGSTACGFSPLHCVCAQCRYGCERLWVYMETHIKHVITADIGVNEKQVNVLTWSPQACKQWDGAALPLQSAPCWLLVNLQPVRHKYLNQSRHEGSLWDENGCKMWEWWFLFSYCLDHSYETTNIFISVNGSITKGGIFIMSVIIISHQSVIWLTDRLHLC